MMKVLIALLVLFLVAPVRAAEIAVAAASDLKFALDELAQEFRTNHPGTSVKFTYGSSGNFFAQLQNRAPFDLYFSADIEYPRKLAAAGLALETNVFLYGIGRIVVWAPTNSPLNVTDLGLRAVLDPAAKKVAVANPQHAPYGRAAVAALKSLGVYERVEPRLVFGENVAQTAQFVQSGSADVGIIALALAVAPQMREAGQFWEIPSDAYPRMEQGGIVLKWAKDIDSARMFRDFVLSEHGCAVLKRYGFFLPEK